MRIKADKQVTDSEVDDIDEEENESQGDEVEKPKSVEKEKEDNDKEGVFIDKNLVNANEVAE